MQRIKNNHKRCIYVCLTMIVLSLSNFILCSSFLLEDFAHSEKKDQTINMKPQTSSSDVSREMFPVVFNSEFDEIAFNEIIGLNYTNIRVAYFDETASEWNLIPFQIDEIGNPLNWERIPGNDKNEEGATLQAIEHYIPYGDPYGFGEDENPGKIDANDELVFYIKNGDQTPEWWNSR